VFWRLAVYFLVVNSKTPHVVVEGLAVFVTFGWLALLLVAVQRSQYLFAVMGGVYCCPYLDDLALGINEKCIALGHLDAIVVAHGSIERYDFLILIAQKFEAQAFLGTEFLVTAGRVDTDAHDYGTQFLILVHVLLKIVRFNGAAGGHVLGIEVKDHPLATETVETDVGTILRRQSKVGRHLTGLRQGGIIRFSTDGQGGTGEQNHQDSDESNSRFFHGNPPLD